MQHINDMTGAIHLEDTLKKAEGIHIQMKQSKKLPDALKEIIGMDVTPNSSNSSSNFVTPAGTPVGRDNVPKIENLTLPKENGHSNPSSGSGTAVTTPDDSSIEILTENGGDVGVSHMVN